MEQLLTIHSANEIALSWSLAQFFNYNFQTIPTRCKKENSEPAGTYPAYVNCHQAAKDPRVKSVIVPKLGYSVRAKPTWDRT